MDSYLKSTDRSEMDPEDYSTLRFKKIQLPTAIPVDPYDIKTWIQRSMALLKTVPGLSSPLQCKEPSEDDEKFLEAFKQSLTEAGEPTLKTKKLARDLRKAKNGYKLAEANIKCYLIQSAEKDKTILRMILKHSGEQAAVFDQLVQDYDKTSSDNAISLKGKLYALKFSKRGTCTEFIEQAETLEADILNAGGHMDQEELAGILLNQGKVHPRYSTPVSAYITQLQREGMKPEWVATKAFMLNLDRTTQALEDEEPPIKAMYSGGGRYRSRKESKKQHLRSKATERYADRDVENRVRAFATVGERGQGSEPESRAVMKVSNPYTTESKDAKESHVPDKDGASAKRKRKHSTDSDSDSDSESDSDSNYTDNSDYESDSDDGRGSKCSQSDLLRQMKILNEALRNLAGQNSRGPYFKGYCSFCGKHGHSEEYCFKKVY